MAKMNEKCSFCGRSKKEVDLLIAGLDASICNFCVEQAAEIIRESSKKSSQDSFGMNKKELPKPVEIKKFLDQYIIGQDSAKKTLSVAVYNHYKRLLQYVGDDDVEIEKSNIIMVGSTGTGKTL